MFGQNFIGYPKVVEDAFPFAISEYKLDSSTICSDNFQLPKNKHITNFLIKELSFDNGFKYYVLIYKDNSANQFVCIDLNRNKSFIDDSIYNSKSMYLNDLSYNGLKKLPTFKLNDGKKYIRFLKFCTTNTGISYKSANENMLYLTAYNFDHFFVTIYNAGISYKVLLSNKSLLDYFSNSNTEILIVPKSQKIFPVTSSNIPSDLKQNIYINSVIFKIDSLVKDGSKIYYTVKDNKNGKIFGLTKGKYLIRTRYKDITEEPHYLYSTMKEYTFLEFWGTWCVPCMKLSPTIDNLHKKYQTNVQFIGVAYDENIEAVKKYNRIHRKFWINFYQQRTKDPIIQNLKITNYPTFILLNSNGKILFREQGEEGLKNISVFLKLNKIK